MTLAPAAAACTRFGFVGSLSGQPASFRSGGMDFELEKALGPAEDDSDDKPLDDAEIDDRLADEAFKALQKKDSAAFRDAILGLLGR